MEMTTQVVAPAKTTTPQLRADLLETWVAATNAGGSIGFTSPAPVPAIAETLDAALARVTHGSDALVVLRAGERAVGMGMLVGPDAAIMGHWRSVTRVMVHPDFQGQRGGDRLMWSLHELATSLGLTHLQLTVRDGQRLEDFYRRFGYRVVGRHPQAIRIGPGQYRDEVMLIAPVAKGDPLEPQLSSTTRFSIEQLPGQPDERVLDELAEVLVDCVAGGASLGFLAGLTPVDAGKCWRSYLADPRVLTWVARESDSNRVVGTVSLDLTDKPNGRHRAEIGKLMVHRDARGHNCASRLLAAAEEKARHLGRSLLFLDSESGSLAENLYSRRGWEPVGCVENWAMSPDGTLHPTVFMSKTLIR